MNRRSAAAILRAISAMAVVMAGGLCAPPPDGQSELLEVRRVHVEKLGGGETAGQIRDMIIAGFQNSGLFVITENPDRADAFLRGSAEDLIYDETHDTRGGVNARGSVSIGSSSRGSGSTRASTGGMYVNSQIGEDESSRIVERRHEAAAAVRLVDKDGDVIWSTVQESRGGKFQGASAAVAEKVTKQLLRDYQSAKRARSDGQRPTSAGNLPPTGTQ